MFRPNGGRRDHRAGSFAAAQLVAAGHRVYGTRLTDGRGLGGVQWPLAAAPRNAAEAVEVPALWAGSKRNTTVVAGMPQRVLAG